MYGSKNTMLKILGWSKTEEHFTNVLLYQQAQLHNSDKIMEEMTSGISFNMVTLMHFNVLINAAMGGGWRVPHYDKVAL